MFLSILSRHYPTDIFYKAIDFALPDRVTDLDLAPSQYSQSIQTKKLTTVGRQPGDRKTKYVKINKRNAQTFTGRTY